MYRVLGVQLEPISLNNRTITLASLKVPVTYNLGVRNNLFVCFKDDKSSYFNQSTRHNRQLCKAVIAMDRHLGFMVSSATALVKFLCDIGKNLVKKTRSDKLKAPDAGNNI